MCYQLPFSLDVLSGLSVDVSTGKACGALGILNMAVGVLLPTGFCHLLLLLFLVGSKGLPLPLSSFLSSSLLSLSFLSPPLPFLPLTPAPSLSSAVFKGTITHV